jgi:hypothetical protein
MHIYSARYTHIWGSNKLMVATHSVQRHSPLWGEKLVTVATNLYVILCHHRIYAESTRKMLQLFIMRYGRFMAMLD